MTLSLPRGHEFVSIRGIAGTGGGSLHNRSLRQEEDGGEEIDHREGLGGVEVLLEEQDAEGEGDDHGGSRRVNDAELLVLARVLKCGVADLYPKRPGNLDRVVRRGGR
jgi:hypothetical protein